VREQISNEPLRAAAVLVLARIGQQVRFTLMLSDGDVEAVKLLAETVELNTRPHLKFVRGKWWWMSPKERERRLQAEERVAKKAIQR
jgi:hypothetical protein